MVKDITKYTPGHDPHETRHTLYLWGGAAIVVFGAGLILSTPAARRQLGGGLSNLFGGGVAKDFMRYLRMRAM